MREKMISLMIELRNEIDREIENRVEEDEFNVLRSDDLAQIGNMLNVRRKMLKLDIQTLEWQTGLSSSTLKRIFKDPSQVKFMSVVLVAETLGVKLCFAK